MWKIYHTTKNFVKALPFFSSKGLNSNKMLVKEKGELVSDEKQLQLVTKIMGKTAIWTFLFF